MFTHSHAIEEFSIFQDKKIYISTYITLLVRVCTAIRKSCTEKCEPEDNCNCFNVSKKTDDSYVKWIDNAVDLIERWQAHWSTSHWCWIEFSSDIFHIFTSIYIHPIRGKRKSISIGRVKKSHIINSRFLSIFTEKPNCTKYRVGFSDWMAFNLIWFLQFLSFSCRSSYRG